jgi:hypothetical protein
MVAVSRSSKIKMLRNSISYLRWSQNTVYSLPGRQTGLPSVGAALKYVNTTARIGNCGVLTGRVHVCTGHCIAADVNSQISEL